ncbi:MAG TPA: ScyD/ScyE family protein [Pyrinomonadaceae bacterium]|nr:ScyD/ScyE family protein [Pyrinomonadaceae bacterium]
MNTRKSLRAISFVALFGAAAAALVFDGRVEAARAAAAGETQVVAAGLNNPRGLAFGPDGALYVAEAGSGGEGPCAEGPEGPRCYGPTGSVTRVDLRKGGAARVATGLPSAASPEDGSFATGPHDISLQGRGQMFVTIGYAGDPNSRTDSFGPAGTFFARLARVNASGNWSLQEDLGAYEAAANPAGDEVDSNPYGVLALAGRQVVADAGANALNEVAADGSVRTLAVFPDRLVEAPDFLELPPGTEIPMDAVPTSVAAGPDGMFYVGQLNGFPFPVGGANVYRVPAQGGTPEVFASGFTAVVDVAFGPDGSLYVLEIAKNGLLAAFIANDWTGALVRVAPDGTRTELAAGELFAPGGVAVGPDGAIYVTNNSIFSGTGEVLRIGSSEVPFQRRASSSRVSGGKGRR